MPRRIFRARCWTSTTSASTERKPTTVSRERTSGDRSRKRIDFFEAEYGRPEFRVGTAGQKGCFAISWGSAVEKRLKEWLSAPGGGFLMERGPICGLYCFGFRQRWAFGIGGSRASRYRSGKPRSVQSPL